MSGGFDLYPEECFVWVSSLSLPGPQWEVKVAGVWTWEPAENSCGAAPQRHVLFLATANTSEVTLKQIITMTHAHFHDETSPPELLAPQQQSFTTPENYLISEFNWHNFHDLDGDRALCGSRIGMFTRSAGEILDQRRVKCNIDIGVTFTSTVVLLTLTCEPRYSENSIMCG